MLFIYFWLSYNIVKLQTSTSFHSWAIAILKNILFYFHSSLKFKTQSQLTQSQFTGTDCLFCSALKAFDLFRSLLVFKNITITDLIWFNQTCTIFAPAHTNKYILFVYSQHSQTKPIANLITHYFYWMCSVNPNTVDINDWSPILILVFLAYCMNILKYSASNIKYQTKVSAYFNVLCRHIWYHNMVLCFRNEDTGIKIMKIICGNEKYSLKLKKKY